MLTQVRPLVDHFADVGKMVIVDGFALFLFIIGKMTEGGMDFKPERTRKTKKARNI